MVEYLDIIKRDVGVSYFYEFERVLITLDESLLIGWCADVDEVLREDFNGDIYLKIMLVSPSVTLLRNKIGKTGRLSVRQKGVDGCIKDIVFIDGEYKIVGCRWGLEFTCPEVEYKLTRVVSSDAIVPKR